MADHLKIAKAIADTMRAAGEPLTEGQYMMLVGALAVWLSYKGAQGDGNG